MLCIKKFRLSKGLTQQDLAVLLGVRQNSVSLWERGFREPPIDKLIALSKIFNCSLDELVKEE